jgi:FtsH-binding integral membrane protein
MGVGDFHIDFDDIEKGFGQSTALYPGIAADENKLRWGFIRKVYGILSVQFVLTTVVAGLVVLSASVNQFFQSNPASVLVLAFLPLVLMCPLYAYQQSHPLNLILLGLFTVSISLSVGISCSLAPRKFILEIVQRLICFMNSCS